VAQNIVKTSRYSLEIFLFYYWETVLVSSPTLDSKLFLVNTISDTPPLQRHSAALLYSPLSIFAIPLFVLALQQAGYNAADDGLQPSLSRLVWSFLSFSRQK